MDTPFLHSIGLCIFGATLIGTLFYYLRQPLILAYLVTGIVLGPSVGLGLIQDHHQIQIISEIGLIVMMFVLGLSIHVPELLRAGKIVLITGTLQITCCLGLCAALFFFWRPDFAQTSYEIIYLAIALAVSSTALVIKVLSDQQETGRLTSRITLGILILQDVIVIVFLGFQPNFSNPDFLMILISFVKITGLVGSAFLGSKYLLPRVYRSIAKQPELMMIVSLGWCFFLVGAFQALGLSKEMGALVAGLSMASFPYNMDVIAKISSLRDFFISLFFVALGLQVPPLSFTLISHALILVGIILGTRLLTVFPPLLMMKLGGRAGFVTSLNLAQLSEFSLVFAALGLELQHISRQTLDVLIITMIFTSALAPYLIKFAYPIYQRILKIRKASTPEAETQETTQHRPTLVLLGLYREGSSLLEDLLQKYSDSFRSELLVVDYNPQICSALQRRGIPAVYGDISHMDTLRNLGLPHAQIIICTIQDYILNGTTNLKLLGALKQLAPQAKIIVCADTLTKAQSMYEQGAEYVIVPRTIIGHYVADVIESIRAGNSASLQETALSFLKNRKEVLE